MRPYLLPGVTGSKHGAYFNFHPTKCEVIYILGSEQCTSVKIVANALYDCTFLISYSEFWKVEKPIWANVWE